MNINEVIKYPVLTEKTYAQMQSGKVYTFVVDYRTNKTEVRKVVEFIFDVKVGKVNMMTYDRKPKRVGKYKGFTNRIKKAIVTLSEGQINLFPDETPVDTEAPTSVVSAATPPANDEPTDVEKRAAAKIAAQAAAKAAPAEEPAEEVTPAPDAQPDATPEEDK